MKRILGIESSCDDAATAIVGDGHVVLAECVSSQAEEFRAWGGVVPELAARGHIAALPTLVDQALQSAGMTAGELDGIAVGAWPGLIGSLLAGVTCAKMMALRLNLPLIAVDHIAAHLAAVHVGRASVPYPHVGLVASGGHSHLYLCAAPGEYTLLGGTIDDAAGEAFDKAAAVLGLGYPGGPEVDRRAQTGSPTAWALPRSFLNDQTLRFSFAGLKTALLYRARGPGGTGPAPTDGAQIADACASFQAAVVDCLSAKLLLAAEQYQVKTIAIAGGVACNRGLRQRLQDDSRECGLTLLLPEPRHCADNAAMIATLGHHLLERGQRSGADLVPLPTGRAGPRQR